MPKLIHKDKITRLKTYNYTTRHDNLAKNIGLNKVYKTKKELMEDAGYKDTNATSNVVSISKMLREEGEDLKSVAKIKAIRDKSEDEKNILASAKMILDITGAFKEVAEKTISITKDVEPTEDEKRELDEAFNEAVKP